MSQVAAVYAYYSLRIAAQGGTVHTCDVSCRAIKSQLVNALKTLLQVWLHAGGVLRKRCQQLERRGVLDV